MTRVLAVAVIVAQLLDVVTWMAMPRAAEVNPLARDLHSQVGWLFKVALVVLVLGIQPALRPRYSAVGELVAVVAIAVGCVGAGSNLAVLAAVNAAEAPRSATQPAPIASEATGIEQGGSTPAVPERTPAPGSMWARQAPARLAPAAIAAPATLHGLASWYAAGGPAAAAGPELRRALGPHWRGKVVTVCAGTCIPVELVDWCQCYRGQNRERLIDLGLEAFARLERPSAGLLRVTIVLGPPATDVPRGTVP